MAHSLEGCVSSLREAMSTLDATITTLDAGVSDLPRLSKVLNTTRHFELVSEPDLAAAQTALQSEIEPEVHNLLGRVSTYIDKLERREQSLKAQYELNLGRLVKDDEVSSVSAFKSVRSKLGASTSSAPVPDPLEAMKMQQLRQKKERLSFAIDRLQMQATHRQRELRKSMAAQPVISDDEF